MTHHFITVESGPVEVACIVCGAHYLDGGNGASRCSGRTDLIHGYDTSAHSLDGCQQYDDTGDCDHLAIGTGCDCLHCS